MTDVLECIFHDGLVDASAKCHVCKEVVHIKNLDQKQLEKFVYGSKVQDCFPELDADSREFLISRVCGKCYDLMFA